MLRVFVSRRRADQTLRLRRRYPEILRGRIQIISYEGARWRFGLPGGAFLFTNLEELDWGLFERARLIAAAIRASDPDAVIFNDPRTVLRRYELVRALYRDGVNSFDGYRVDEGRVPTRWPVFLRGEYDHRGGVPNLIESEADLRAILDAPESHLLDPSRRLIVEFIDTRAKGCETYRKYAAFRVGSELIPAHIYFGEHWMVKMNRAPTADELVEEEEYLASNPHGAEVMSIFERAGIEYGRIDYSVGENGIEVWEINTNPTVTNPKIEQMKKRWHVAGPVIEKVARALAALAEQGSGRPAIPFQELRPIRPRWWRNLGG